MMKINEQQREIGIGLLKQLRELDEKWVVTEDLEEKKKIQRSYCQLICKLGDMKIDAIDSKEMLVDQMYTTSSYRSVLFNKLDEALEEMQKYLSGKPPEESL